MRVFQYTWTLPTLPLTKVNTHNGPLSDPELGSKKAEMLVAKDPRYTIAFSPTPIPLHTADFVRRVNKGAAAWPKVYFTSAGVDVAGPSPTISRTVSSSFAPS